MSKIYFIKCIKYYVYEKTEDEISEECSIIGYFSSLDVVKQLINERIENKLLNREFVIKSFDVDLERNQKYVYVITRDYSKQEEDETTTDLEYKSEPKASRAECEALICKLKELPEYKITPNDGFVIRRYKINEMDYPAV